MNLATKLTFALLAISAGVKSQSQNTIGLNFIYNGQIRQTDGPVKGIGTSYNISMANSSAHWVKMLNVERITIEGTWYDLSKLSGIKNIAAFDHKLNQRGYFGQQITMASGIDIRLVNINGMKLLLNPTIGLLYSTESYHSTRGMNQILGGRLNALGSIRLKADLPLNDATHLQIGAGIAHSSNSNTSSPNIGLNKVESFIGLARSVTPAKHFTPTFNLKRSALSFELTAGYTSQVKTGFYQLKGVNLQLDKSFREKTTPIGKASFSTAYTYYLNDVLGVKAGADIVYSAKISPMGTTTSDTARFIKTFQGDYTPVYSHFNVGLNAGIDARLGRFVFTGSYGYYLGNYESYVYQPGQNHFEYGRMFYTTLTARYFITNKFAVVAKSYLKNFGGIGVNMSI